MLSCLSSLMGSRVDLAYLLSISLIERAGGFVLADLFFVFFFASLDGLFLRRPRFRLRYSPSTVLEWLTNRCNSRLSIIGRMESNVSLSRRRIASTSVTHSSSRTSKNFVTSIPGRPAFSQAFSRSVRSAAFGLAEAATDSTAVETTDAPSVMVTTVSSSDLCGSDELKDLDFTDLLDLADLTDSSPNDMDAGSGSLNASTGSLFKPSADVLYPSLIDFFSSSDSALLTSSAIV
mmetsp:Transcript_20561/g.33886  ORF Transcript_20561/g.33886 Transcript_20561/m.33886 type:complete len:234 (-) Transcript_20561:402-1103(-)